MVIVVLTVDRKPQYIHRCISSIRKEYNGIIHLMIGGNQDYLKRYTKGFIKHKSDEDEITENYKKAARGYSNCVKLGHGQGVLIIEDDTEMRKGWYQLLELYIATIQDKHYVLSLGDVTPGSIENPAVKRPSLQKFLYRCNIYPPKVRGDEPEAVILTWYDTHAVYLPPTIDFEGLTSYMRYFGSIKGSMHDVVLGYYMYRKVIPIYITVPSLCKNIGAYTSNVGRNYAMNFDFSDWDYATL